MFKLFNFFAFFIFLTINAQTSYINKDNKKHLCGSFKIETLKTDTNYSKWYNKYYSSFNLPEKNTDWKENLKDVKVDIYLGTWCGDSKYWVSRFVKLWNDLNLDENQLNFIALYDLEDKYKEAPNNEQKSKFIHRVPTFIFNKNDNEIARIVESPKNDLFTDLAQIALNIPSKPNYRAANFGMFYFENNTIDTLNNQYDKLFYTFKHLANKSKELNTLGYLFLKRDELEKGKLILKLNKDIFPFEPNVYDSYAEALYLLKDKKEAKKQYLKVLELQADNKNAQEQLEKLKKEGY